MPIRVRCGECDKVLNAPDAARGKAVKCSGCGARVRVPLEERKRKKKKKPTRKRRPPTSAVDDEDFLSGMDLRDDRMEDAEVRICPKCAKIVGVDDIECSYCGVDLETGQLSERQRKRQTRKGPDPDEYWGMLWKDSFAFVKQHWGVALKTGWVFALCMTLASAAFFCVFWCHGRQVDYIRAKNLQTLEDMKKQGIEEERIPAPHSEATLVLLAYRSPPVVFWYGVGTLFVLSIGGWYWNVSKQIITVTMANKPLKKVESDLVGNFAFGIKAACWPYLVSIPCPPLIFFSILVFPIAMIHLTQRHTYKAYLPYSLLKSFGRAALPVLYWCLMFVVVNLVVIIIGVLAGIVFQASLIGWLEANREKIVEWLNSNTFGADPDGFIVFTFFALPVMTLLCAAMFFPIGILMGFTSVIMMRANGILGRYFRPEMELVTSTSANIPCGFWPRWLAFMIDSLVVWLLQLGVLIIVFLLQLLLSVYPAVAVIVGGVGSLLSLVVTWFYFVRSHTGLGQATVGKRALGIIVTDMEFNPISTGQASGRFFSRIFLSGWFLAGYIMAAFTPKKQALHDQLAKTLVVWKGDND